jgi:hypothetical protein
MLLTVLGYGALNFQRTGQSHQEQNPSGELKELPPCWAEPKLLSEHKNQVSHR